MAPVLNWTPRSSCPHQGQGPGAREPRKGRTELVLSKKQLGPRTQLRGEKGEGAWHLHPDPRAFPSLSLKGTCSLFRVEHGYPCIFSTLRRTFHSEKVGDRPRRPQQGWVLPAPTWNRCFWKAHSGSAQG